MSEYSTQDGKIAYVAPAPFSGDFTFYLRDAINPHQRGNRVKGRKQRLYFATKAEAETALSDYAKERGWKHV